MSAGEAIKKEDLWSQLRKENNWLEGFFSAARLTNTRLTSHVEMNLEWDELGVIWARSPVHYCVSSVPHGSPCLSKQLSVNSGKQFFFWVGIGWRFAQVSLQKHYKRWRSNPAPLGCHPTPLPIQYPCLISHMFEATKTRTLLCQLARSKILTWNSPVTSLWV